MGSDEELPAPAMIHLGLHGWDLPAIRLLFCSKKTWLKFTAIEHFDDDLEFQIRIRRWGILNLGVDMAET